MQEVYEHNVKSLLSGFEKGYEKEYFGTDWNTKDTELLSRVQNNIFAFSGAKSFAESQELRDAVYQNGKILSKADFARKAKKVNKKYNLQYLDAERHQVIASGTQGSRWNDFEDTANTHPYLEYVTAKDERVREEHRRLQGVIYHIDDPFWSSFYPPNGWRCRCSVRKHTEREYNHKKKDYEGKNRTAMPNSEDAQKIAGKVVAKPFRHNVGKAKIVFEDKHPYFQANPDARKQQLSAVKNYGMSSVKQIYNSPKKLSPYKQEIQTEKDYRESWSILEHHYNKDGKEGEGFTFVDKKRNISAHFDNDLKEKMIKKKRHTYFDEAIEVFQRPDEIWGVIKGTSKQSQQAEIFNAYIKYYEDKPIVLLVNDKGRVDSFYKWDKGLSNFEDFRKGLLKKKN